MLSVILDIPLWQPVNGLREEHGRRIYSFFTLTKGSIHAIQWYELPTGDTSEIEVIAYGKKFIRKIENLELKDEQRRSSLKQIIKELATEINESLRSSPLSVK